MVFNWTATILYDSLGYDHLSCHGGLFRVVSLGMNREGVTSSFVYKSATAAWTATASTQKTAAAIRDHHLGNKATALVWNTLFF